MPKEKHPTTKDGVLRTLSMKPVVEWTSQDCARFLRHIGLGGAGSELADFVVREEVPGYMLVANADKPENLVEMFGTFGLCYLPFCSWLRECSREVAV